MKAAEQYDWEEREGREGREREVVGREEERSSILGLGPDTPYPPTTEHNISGSKPPHLPTESYEHVPRAGGGSSSGGGGGGSSGSGGCLI